MVLGHARVRVNHVAMSAVVWECDYVVMMVSYGIIVLKMWWGVGCDLFLTNKKTLIL